MEELLKDLQEANASFRCGTCPGGSAEECDDQCEKHRLEYQAEELKKKGYVIKAPLRLTSMKHKGGCLMRITKMSGSRLVDLFKQYEIAWKLRDTASMHARPLDAWNISRYGMLVSEERRLAAKLGRAFYTESVTEAVETNGQEVS